MLGRLEGTIVEIGPGTGTNFRYYPRGVRWIGVEPNPYMHAELQRRAARSGIDVQIRSITGDAIDLDDQSVDAVISSLLLCTVADPVQVVSEIRRILRPGGRIAVLDLARHRFEEARELYLDERLGFSEAELMDWLEKAGFRNVTTSIVDREMEPPQFQTLLAIGEK